MELITLIGLSIGLGLLGLIEPCTVGSHLLFIKYLDDKTRTKQMLHLALFVVTRALIIGALGAVAVLIGSAIFNIQRIFWIVLGSGYLLFGLLYLSGRQEQLMVALGPSLQPQRSRYGAATLGLLFGLNVPACAAPLLTAVLGASLGAASISQGFWTLALFGMALSLPLAVLVRWPRGRGWLAWLAAQSQTMPLWTGTVFLLLGAWSIYLGVST
jgi:cytochrome c-type biogenesis protein